MTNLSLPSTPGSDAVTLLVLSYLIKSCPNPCVSFRIIKIDWTNFAFEEKRIRRETLDTNEGSWDILNKDRTRGMTER